MKKMNKKNKKIGETQFFVVVAVQKKNRFEK